MTDWQLLSYSLGVAMAAMGIVGLLRRLRPAQALAPGIFYVLFGLIGVLIAALALRS